MPIRAETVNRTKRLLGYQSTSDTSILQPFNCFPMFITLYGILRNR